jgi:hypothetical protein
MISTIIFSKDRACQLDLTLRTYYRFVKIPANVTVLYTTSSARHKEGYVKLIAKNGLTKFVEEAKSFKEELTDIVTKVTNDRIMFLVDDDVFINNVLENDPPVVAAHNVNDVLTVSLRLGQNIVWDYNHNCKAHQPPFVPGDVLKWAWRKAPPGWNYPMSNDGNIFNTADILPLVRDGGYVTQPGFEAWTSKHPNKNKAYIVCYNKSRLFGMCLNRVQNIYKNKCGGSYSPEALNERWLAGERISFSNFVNFVPPSCHFDFPELKFEKQEGNGEIDE